MRRLSYEKGAAQRFDLERYFPRSVMEAIAAIRVDDPELVVREAARRRRRERLAPDGRLVIIAVDHPGRGVTVIGDDPLRMGNRWEYLGRTLRALAAPGVDGVMGTPDFLEEIIIANHLITRGGGPSLLDEKILVGCMQRGGVAGVAGEINDRFGSYTAEALEAMRFDGGKMLIRAVPDDPATLATVDYCARAVTELSRRRLAAFVEPLPQRREGNRYLADYTLPNLVKWVGVVAALGETARYTWIKIPYVDQYERVAAATSLPILMLGGESKGDPTGVIESFAAGMKAGPNVRGAMVGRNVTFPGALDPGRVAAAVAAVIHDGLSVDGALAVARGEDPVDVADFAPFLRG